MQNRGSTRDLGGSKARGDGFFCGADGLGMGGGWVGKEWRDW